MPLRAALAVGIDGGITLRLGWSLAMPAYLLFGMVASIVTVTDLLERRIRNRVVALGALSLLGVAAWLSGDSWPLARAAVAMVVLVGFYLALGLAFPSGVGFGDPLTELRRNTTFTLGRRATMKATDRS